MAQDPRKALDDKTRKLTQGNRIETGKEHQAYQASQQQLLAIQAERQQNLAVAREEARADLMNNQTLAQAAELGAISAAEAEQAAMMGGEGVQLNPATQAVLGKYGVGQPKFVRTHSQNQQVTKQNITINNNTNVNTTNDVRVPANIGGPVQGRPLQFKQGGGSTGGDSMGKFKSWISSAFQRQNEEGARRDREFRNRESSLSRSASRMMKKLEDIGNTIGTRMDPRKIGSTWQSQLKTLMLIFGFGYLAKNWTKILSKVSSIEEKVRGWLEFFGVGKDGESQFSIRVRNFFGLQPGEGVRDALNNVFGERGIWGAMKTELKYFFKERADAVKQLTFPQIDTEDIKDPLNALITKIFPYLGNLLKVAIGGLDALKDSKLSEIKGAADTSLDDSIKGKKDYFYKNAKGQQYKDYYDPIEKRMLSGDEATANTGAQVFTDSQRAGKEFGLSLYSRDIDGNLNQSHLYMAGAGHSSQIVKDINNSKKFGKLESSSRLAKLFENLHAGAKTSETKRIPVEKSFIDALLTPDQIKQFESSKDIVERTYAYVLREKTFYDALLEDTSPEANAIKAGINTAIRGQISSASNDIVNNADVINATVLGAGIGTMIAPGAGTGIGAGIGAIVGHFLANSEIFQTWKEHVRTRTSALYMQDLVPVDELRKQKNKYKGYKTTNNGKNFVTTQVWEVTEKVIDQMVRNAANLKDEDELKSGDYQKSNILKGFESNYNSVSGSGDIEIRKMEAELKKGEKAGSFKDDKDLKKRFGSDLNLNSNDILFSYSNGKLIAPKIHFRESIQESKNRNEWLHGRGGKSLLFNYLKRAGVINMSLGEFLELTKNIDNTNDLLEFGTKLINEHKNLLNSQNSSEILEGAENFATSRKEELEGEKNAEYNAVGGNWLLDKIHGNYTNYVSDITSEEQLKNARYIADKLIGAGFTENQAYGIIGNLMQESSLDPKSFNGNDKGRPAAGLAGWRTSRLESLFKFAGVSGNHLNASSSQKAINQIPFEKQVDFLIAELTDKNYGETGNADEIKKTTTVEDAAYTTDMEFERSDHRDLNRRIGYAQRIATKLSNGSWTVGSNVDVSKEEKPETETSEDKDKDKKKDDESYITKFWNRLKDMVMGAWDSTTSYVKDKYGKAKDKFKSFLPFSRRSNEDIMGSGMHYGNVSSAYGNYADYIKYNDDLPAGMSRLEWEEYVHQKTGAYPENLQSRVNKGLNFKQPKDKTASKKTEETPETKEESKKIESVLVDKYGTKFNIMSDIMFDTDRYTKPDVLPIDKSLTLISRDQLPQLIKLSEQGTRLQETGLVQNEKNQNIETQCFNGLNASIINSSRSNIQSPTRSAELYVDSNTINKDLA